MVNVPVFRGKRLGWVNESRLASFIATTNVYQVLIDSTGSRRFLCVEVLKPISEEPLEHKQIYAQLKEEPEIRRTGLFKQRRRKGFAET